MIFEDNRRAARSKASVMDHSYYLGHLDAIITLAIDQSFLIDAGVITLQPTIAVYSIAVMNP